MKNNIIQNKKGFTLIELMTVMAIIGILAASVMAYLSVQKKRAAGSKVLTELAGVMHDIYLCKSDDGKISNPLAGRAICGLNPNYGAWPDLTGTDFTYQSIDGDLDTASWAYSAESSEEIVCCNSTYGKCNKLDGNVCRVNTVLK